MFADLTDVSTRLGRPIADEFEAAQVEAWIGDVEAIITARIPTLAARVTSGAPSATLVASVVANAVIRKVKNPDGKVSEGIDDYTYRLNDDARRGELFITDAEWSLLSPAAGSSAFSVRPSFEPDLL